MTNNKSSVITFALTSCLLSLGCTEMDLSDPAVEEVTTEGVTSELSDDEYEQESFVRYVCPWVNNVTIRSTPGGTPVGTLWTYESFRVDDPRDGVWFRGVGYNYNGYIVAPGFVLAQYLC